jgi:hypothetical protein
MYAMQPVDASPVAQRVIGTPPHDGPTLEWMVSVSIAFACLLHLTTWLPNYLIWPWSPDHDVFATLARSWEAGILPYKDLYANNLPATIYIYWVLGKLFGWGRTIPFQAFDATLVLLLGGVMLAWSRRRFGTYLPAGVGYLGFLAYYCNLNHSMAGERDWHATFFVVIGLMLAQGWPDRAGWLGSALAASVAVAIRPQAVLFLPVLMAAVGTGTAEGSKLGGRSVWVVVFWTVIFGTTLALSFTPLMRAGVFNDFVHQFGRGAYGGRHIPLTPLIFASRCSDSLCRADTLVILIPVAVLAASANPASRRLGQIWVAALVMAIVYKAISPRQHLYLNIPKYTMLAMATASLVGLSLQVRAAPALHLTILLLAVGVFAQWKQPYDGLTLVLPSIKELRRGIDPARPVFTMGYVSVYGYRDYQALLEHLRAMPPGTRIANALNYPLALTGPTGRLSAFPAESLAWVLFVRSDDEAKFADLLERTPDSVVVWVPDEFLYSDVRRLSRIEATIRRSYEPKEKFGDIEVWQRTSSIPTDASPYTSDRLGSSLRAGFFRKDVKPD